MLKMGGAPLHPNKQQERENETYPFFLSHSNIALLSLKSFSYFFFLSLFLFSTINYGGCLRRLLHPVSQSCCNWCLLRFWLFVFHFLVLILMVVVLQGLCVEDEECGRGEMLAFRWGWARGRECFAASDGGAQVQMVVPWGGASEIRCCSTQIISYSSSWIPKARQIDGGAAAQ